MMLRSYSLAPSHPQGGATPHSQTAAVASASTGQNMNQTNNGNANFGQMGKGLAGNDPSGDRGFQANGATQAGGASNATGQAASRASIFGEKNDTIASGAGG
ncbi:hypothetical protein RvY_04647 [Ramazzottius varieornatus]|uniref:Uncharacterized protein n=1 Tax=Ramazzottius varieornatus TaxID=947166 RepID=A0A1D1UVT6_RAMVA|nr:hypothetical protein RvY_04647 [Ramazzottius varieornatus]